MRQLEVPPRTGKPGVLLQKSAQLFPLAAGPEHDSKRGKRFHFSRLPRSGRCSTISQYNSRHQDPCPCGDSMLTSARSLELKVTEGTAGWMRFRCAWVASPHPMKKPSRAGKSGPVSAPHFSRARARSISHVPRRINAHVQEAFHPLNPGSPHAPRSTDTLVQACQEPPGLRPARGERPKG